MKLRTFFPLVIALTTTGVYAQNAADSQSPSTDRQSPATDIQSQSRDNEGLVSDTQSYLGQHNFDNYDNDKNGSMSRDEFDKAVETTTIYEKYDANSDGRISKDEYASIGVDKDMEIWDADGDGYLDSDEFYDGTFTSFDDNQDGNWDDNEWNDAGEAGLLDRS